MQHQHEHSLKRRSSLRFPAQPPPIPIPPSLIESPYLKAPRFRQESSAPCVPTEEDERWLQDTVPIQSQPSESQLSRRKTVPASAQSRNPSRPAPSSPPITLWRQPPPTNPPPQVVLEPITQSQSYQTRLPADQSYFPSVSSVQ